MAVSGPKPKPPGMTQFRGKAAHDWTEVEDVPFKGGGRRLPKYRPNGKKWSNAAKKRWDTWRQMPHCILWSDADWDYCLDAVEVAERWYDDGGITTAAELRMREAQMGTTVEARRDLRIRYVEPKKPALAVVKSVNSFKDL